MKTEYKCGDNQAQNKRKSNLKKLQSDKDKDRAYMPENHDQRMPDGASLRQWAAQMKESKVMEKLGVLESRAVDLGKALTGTLLVPALFGAFNL